MCSLQGCSIASLTLAGRKLYTHSFVSNLCTCILASIKQIIWKVQSLSCVCLKELERGMELSNSSYQRQLAAERKKTVGAQEEIRTLQEELDRLTNKLKVHIYIYIYIMIYVMICCLTFLH